MRFILTGTPAKSNYPLRDGIKIVSSFEAGQKARFEQIVHIREIRKECLNWKPDVVIYLMTTYVPWLQMRLCV